jgi:hypothetical protein
MNLSMKPVVYRGGLVSFQIPASWREDYEPDGGGTFYEDIPNSGTLRLNVLSMEKKETLAPGDAAREVFAGQPSEMLLGGFPMRRYVVEGEERGTPLHLHRWEILVPVSPTRWRLACFTHTIVAAAAAEVRAQEELTLVDSIVREAKYSTQAGTVVEKPWWKFW